MLADVKVKHSAYHRLNLLYARVAKFKNVLAVAAYQVVVLTILVAFFVHGHVPAKLMTRHQVTCNKMLYGVINSSAAHAMLFIFHPQV